MSGVDDDLAFQALASPARRRVLALVRDEPRSVGDLAEVLHVSQPAVSQHLAALRSAGLVTVEADGRRRIYRPDLRTLAELRSFFDAYWTSALHRLDAAAVERLEARGAAS
jgi:DNA-binding transcriptional ArsR family regulator